MIQIEPDIYAPILSNMLEKINQGREQPSMAYNVMHIGVRIPSNVCSMKKSAIATVAMEIYKQTILQIPRGRQWGFMEKYVVEADFVEVTATVQIWVSY